MLGRHDAHLKIKEAARICGLTEKAIRFYESKGLIEPDIHIYEQNGRAFRDYDEATVERLKTIAGLRKSFFSVEQIARMLDDPDEVGAVYGDYLAGLRAQYEQLDLLIRRADALPADALSSAKALSDALSRELPAADADSPAQNENGEHKREDAPGTPALSSSVTVPDFHFRIWDEDEGRDELDRLYARYFGPDAGWGKRYTVTLTIRNLWARIWKPLLIGMAALFLLWFFPYIEHVDVQYTGYELLFDTLETDADGTPVVTDVVPRTITFSGQIYHYLLRDTVFKGRISMEGYSYLKWTFAADIRGVDPITVPTDEEARRMFTLKKNRAGLLGNTKPPKVIRQGNGYQVVAGHTESVYLIRDAGIRDGETAQPVWADAVCIYKTGKLSPGTVFLLRERKDTYFPELDAYRCGYSGVIVFPAETEEEARAMFADTVWKHWREEYGMVNAILPFR